MPSQWLVVPSFGGGIRWDTNPAALEDHQWSDADNFIARYGYAEMCPGFTRIINSSTTGPSGQCLGIVPNPKAASTFPGLYLSNNAGTYRLTGIASDGSVTHYAWDGAVVNVTPSSSGTFRAGRLRLGMLNGNAILSVGYGSGTVFNLILFDVSGSTYATIRDPGLLGIHGDFLVSFGGRLVLGAAFVDGQSDFADAQTIRLSGANDPEEWDPSVLSADADYFTLDDADSPLLDLVPLNGNTLGLVTGTTLYGLTPTGGIPPMTRSVVTMHPFQRGGSTRYGDGHIACTTPAGPAILGAADLWLAGQGITGPPYDAIRLSGAEGLANPFWHPERGAIAMRSTDTTAGDNLTLWWFNPTEQVWWRQTVLVTSLGLVTDTSTTGTTLPEFGSAFNTRHVMYVTAPDRVYREASTGVIASGSGQVQTDITDRTYVDTKDFTFGSPAAMVYVDRIKVEWEPLTNATTDALLVQASVRNDPSSGLLGTRWGESDVTFTTVGTLTGGACELPLRLKGKYVRFRFKHASGKVRIRGLAIRYRFANDKVT